MARMKLATSLLIGSTIAFLVVLCVPGCEKKTAGKPQPQTQLKPLLNPPLKWASFVTHEMEEWNLKARNTVNMACGGQGKSREQASACIDEKVPEEQRIRTWSVPVYTGPSRQSEQIGKITITGKVFEGFRMQFVNPAGAAVPFVADNVLEFSDTEALLHTMLEQKEGWVLLPRQPFPSEVWIEVYQVVDIGQEVYEWNEQSIVILEKQATGVFVRQEVSADNACEEAEEPITEDQVKKFSIPWSELYDENHHLRIKQKYTIC